MTLATISEFRNNIKSYINDVDTDMEPLVVTRSDKSAVVVLPMSMYMSYQETDYLLSSPVNAERLRKSAKKARSGKVANRELIIV
jgi:antitoxin YefM